MATIVNPSNDGEIFKVKEDGTIVRTNEINPQGNNTVLEKELLDIIEVNSYSKNILSAYKGRKLANKICKKKYGKPNYKEYVEMLYVKNFPKELEKAELGRKYLWGLRLFFLIIPIWKITIPTYKEFQNKYQ